LKAGDRSFAGMCFCVLSFHYFPDVSEGEYQFNAAEMHRMIGWIRSHPYRFTDLTAQRA
jgi:hypothetical protein